MAQWGSDSDRPIPGTPDCISRGACRAWGDKAAGIRDASSLLAEATVESACAYVDVDDTVDPKSTAAAGVSLRNLLWVRVAPVGAARTAATFPGKLSIDLATDPRRMAAGSYGGRSHPRTENRGLDAALGKMLTEKNEARLQKSEVRQAFRITSSASRRLPKNRSRGSITTHGMLMPPIRSGRPTTVRRTKPVRLSTMPMHSAV
jgi:hypothetical protein